MSLHVGRLYCSSYSFSTVVCGFHGTLYIAIYPKKDISTDFSDYLNNFMLHYRVLVQY